MDERQTIVVYQLDGRRYALPLTVVERAVRAVEVTPWPNAPPSILGAINVQGRVIPVVNVRRRLGLPERELQVDDELLIVRSGTSTVALWVDVVSDVVECDSEQRVAAEEVVPGVTDVAAVVKLPDGLVLIQDPVRLVSADDTSALASVLQREVPRS